MKRQGIGSHWLKQVLAPAMLGTALMSANAVASPIFVTSGANEVVLDTDRDGAVIREHALVYDGIPLTQDDVPSVTIGAGGSTAGSSEPNGYIGHTTMDVGFGIEHDGTDPASWIIDVRFSYSMNAQASGDGAASIVVTNNSGEEEACVASAGAPCPQSTEDAQHFSLQLDPGTIVGMGWTFTLEGTTGLTGGEGEFLAEVSFQVDILGARRLNGPAEVLEPSSLMLSSLGLAGMAWCRRRRSTSRIGV